MVNSSCNRRPRCCRSDASCVRQMSSAKVLFGAVVLALAKAVAGEDATPAPADAAPAEDGAAPEGEDYLYKRPSAEDKFNGLDLGEGITVAFPPWLLVRDSARNLSLFFICFGS
jgi:hypothetical protein